LMSLFLISLTLSFITFLSHKHKSSFIDEGCQRGILQNPPKKKSGIAKGRGRGLRGEETGFRRLREHTHTHTHTHTNTHTHTHTFCYREKDMASWKHFDNSTNVPPLQLLQQRFHVIIHRRYNPLLKALPILLPRPPYLFVFILQLTFPFESCAVSPDSTIEMKSAMTNCRK